MLRRAHAHHREVRAWRDATPSTDEDEDRYLMTTALAPQLSRFGRLLRWSSIGSGGAHSNIKRLAQIGRASSPFNVTNCSLLRHQPTRRGGSPSIPHVTRGCQISIAPAAPPRVPFRGFLPWRFSDAGPRCAAPST